MKEVAAEVLPKGFTYGWTGISYEQQQSGTSSAVIFAFGLLLVFLVLAAQYESWSLPGSVLMAVPFGIIGALVATWARGLENDVYFQIGLLVMIGLAAKNAILIVEFAVELRDKGLSLFKAAIDAGEIRFRPIIMTSLAFIGGTFPLAISSGAGAASRHSLGTGIVGGMIGVSTLALLFVPIFYAWFQGWAEKRAGKTATAAAASLAKRGIPVPTKIKEKILSGNPEAFDVNAQVDVSPDGTVKITNSPGFDPSKLSSRNLGEPQKKSTSSSENTQENEAESVSSEKTESKMREEKAQEDTKDSGQKTSGDKQ